MTERPTREQRRDELAVLEEQAAAERARKEDALRELLSGWPPDQRKRILRALDGGIGAVELASVSGHMLLTDLLSYRLVYQEELKRQREAERGALQFDRRARKLRSDADKKDKADAKKEAEELRREAAICDERAAVKRAWRVDHHRYVSTASQATERLGKIARTVDEIGGDQPPIVKFHFVGLPDQPGRPTNGVVDFGAQGPEDEQP